jgi:hypothetical protein
MGHTGMVVIDSAPRRPSFAYRAFDHCGIELVTKPQANPRIAPVGLPYQAHDCCADLSRSVAAGSFDDQDVAME